MTAPNLPLLERFMLHVEPEPNTGCWLWNSTVNNHGYGRMQVSKRLVLAHRVSFELLRSPIPVGARVLHRCDMPACVNPEHLFLGNDWDNHIDKVLKWRAGRKSRLGLPYGVTYNQGKDRPFTAAVGFKRRLHYLGRFPTAAEAHAVAMAFRDECYRGETNAL